MRPNTSSCTEAFWYRYCVWPIWCMFWPIWLYRRFPVICNFVGVKFVQSVLETVGGDLTRFYFWFLRAYFRRGNNHYLTAQLYDIIWWRLLPSSTSPGIAQTAVEGLAVNWCHKSVEGRLAIRYGGQFHFSGRPHNPTSRFWSSQTSVVTAESFSDRPGPL